MIRDEPSRTAYLFQTELELTVKAENPPRLWPADIYQAFKKFGIAQVKYRFRENLLGQKAFD